MRNGLLLLLLACHWDPDDRDHDWHIAAELGGDDCDDDDPAVHPEASEVCGNGVDDDCDGDAVPCGIGGEMGGQGVPIAGGTAGNDVGRAIADAGDLDGVPGTELAIGAPAWDAGAVWLVAGGQLGDGGALEEVGAALIGEQPGDRFGAVLAGGGDTNGDGRTGLLVGAPGAGAGAGAVYLVEAPHDAVGEVVFAGAPPGAGLGHALAFVGRPGGDAVLLGGPFADDGAAWLFEAPAAGTHDLPDADAKIVGTGLGRLAGIAVTGTDLDGDGRAEVVVGSAAAAGEGVAWVFTDAVGELPLSAADAWFTPGSAVAEVGLAGGCDVDGDGREDLVVGAVGVWWLAGPWEGERGPSRALLLADATTPHVACGGDTDADGADEVLIAAYGAAHVAVPDVTQPPVFSWLSREVPRGLAFGGDLDGDGWDEALVGHTEGGGSVLVFGGGPGY